MEKVYHQLLVELQDTFAVGPINVARITNAILKAQAVEPGEVVVAPVEQLHAAARTLLVTENAMQVAQAEELARITILSVIIMVAPLAMYWRPALINVVPAIIQIYALMDFARYRATSPKLRQTLDPRHLL